MSPQAELRRWRVFATLLALALLAALVALAQPPRPGVDEADRALVERAAQMTAARTRETPEQVRARSAALVVHSAEGPCVELRSYLPSGNGTSVTCFDRLRTTVRSQVLSYGF